MKINAVVYHQSLHLDEGKLLLPDSKCPFCRSGQRKAVCVLQDNPQVLLLECTNCNAASASRMPINTALVEYYRDYYESPVSKPEGQNTFDDPKRFGNYLAIKFNQYLNKPHIRILDFGGGDGSISYWTAKQLLQKKEVDKVDILVVDYNQKVISAQDNRIFLARKDTLESIQFYYDIVIASAIIEHLPQPNDILNRLLNLIDRGGIFYARTPYVVPFIKLFTFFGIKWDFTYPAHVHDLGQEFWESYFNRIVSSTDFEIIESKPSIVETTFNDHFIRTLVAYVFKAPWYLLGRMYKLVGGWEVFVRKKW